MRRSPSGVCPGAARGRPSPRRSRPGWRRGSPSTRPPGRAQRGARTAPQGQGQAPPSDACHASPRPSGRGGWWWLGCGGGLVQMDVGSEDVGGSARPLLDVRETVPDPLRDLLRGGLGEPFRRGRGHPFEGHRAVGPHVVGGDAAGLGAPVPSGHGVRVPGDEFGGFGWVAMLGAAFSGPGVVRPPPPQFAKALDLLHPQDGEGSPVRSKCHDPALRRSPAGARTAISIQRSGP